MTTDSLDVANMIVNDLLRKHPNTIAVLNRHGIDSCCGGATTVEASSVRDGADLDTLIAELRRAMASGA